MQTHQVFLRTSASIAPCTGARQKLPPFAQPDRGLHHESGFSIQLCHAELAGSVT